MKLSFNAIVMAAVVYPAVALQGGYLDSVGSSSAPVKGNWGPSKGAYKVPTAGKSYLDGIAPESAAAPSAPETPTLTVSSLSEMAAESDANPVPVGAYLSSLTGSSSAPVKGNWGPSKGAYKVPAAGRSYLDGIAPESAAAPSAPETPTLTVSSLSEMAAESDANPVSAGAYLSSLKVMSVAGNGEGPVGYLGTLKVESVSAAASKPAGYLDTLRVESAPAGEGGPFTYLETLKGAKTVVDRVASTTEATMQSDEPILAAIQKLNENMAKNQQATMGVLQEINSSVQTLVARAESKASEPQYTEETELTAALAGSSVSEPAFSGQGWRP